MSTKMPNGITMMNNNYQNKSNPHPNKRDDATSNINNSNNKQQSLSNITKSNHTTTSQQPKQPPQQQDASNTVLNVAEMLLHGVADHEILDIWLRGIACQEFAKNFVDAGYDMPTISRITPQDLTAIGITDPTKRLKILSEIKKLNLQDGLPTFKPANLSHWLSLLRLDSHYFEALCDQQIDTIEKACQLTWEDFEELGITKLGHQKRLLLAIERMKDIDAKEIKNLSKPMSEPIYDTNPSQILLVASAENHSMNGPIINKQSSTSELSSTGSGSMHSLYSANSIHYQPVYAHLPANGQHQQVDQNKQQQQLHNQSSQPQNQKQAIYGQLPSQLIKPPQQLTNQTPQIQQQLNQTNHTPQHQQNSHYQSVQPITYQSQFMNSIYDHNNLSGRNTMVPSNRQSLGQLPFALANLPKHQQQLLQQSSIYATLSRQPQRVKQPPPPVPIRTNSLKSNSLFDDDSSNGQQQQQLQQLQQQQQLGTTNTNSASSLYRSGTRVSNRNQFSSLTKNKSFSGNAYMDAARARFLNRNSQQPPKVYNLPQQMQPPSSYNNSVNTNQNTVNNTIYNGTTDSNLMMRRDVGATNGHLPSDGDNLSVYSRQSFPVDLSANQTSTYNQNSINNNSSQVNKTNILSSTTNQRHSALPASTNQIPSAFAGVNQVKQKEDYDVYSDNNSTKSLILPPMNINNSPVNNINRQTSLSQDSGSSQTLYNSASSGSTDHNLNAGSFPRSSNMATSNSTLNDVNFIMDQQQRVYQSDQHGNYQLTNKMNGPTNGTCNATTGKDDDFPPPPSPLVLTDSDEHDLHSMNPDSNFNDLSQRLMTFRVGI